MRKIVVTVMILALAAVVAFAAQHDEVVVPAKITRTDMDGSIFNRDDMLRTEHENGNVTLDVTSLLSSDKKFASGMYKSGKTYFEATDPYGVDEFMYFIEGSVKLTSADGTVQTINAGEAVTIPKEWIGTWDTDGYTKVWVIYSADGSGL
ncbi:MAG: cupin domain-containing protein [Woeseiaceae bacterium]